MRKYFLIALVALSACSAQTQLNDAQTICRDGVEYLSYYKMNSKGDVSYSVVPHYKNTKGELFSCSIGVKK